MSNDYNNESIRKLTDLEAVRTRVSVYAGSADKEGAFTTVKEIISNSIDEFKEGYGDTIDIVYHKDGSITVKDSGRGIPMDWNEGEKEYNYKLLLFTLNAGGKYDSSSYGYSVGLNGIGSSLATMSSEFADIVSIRDGNIYSISSKKGAPEGELRIEKNKDGLPSGTKVRWKPDTDVFDEVNFPDKWFLEYIKRQAIVNKGLNISFTNKEGEVFKEYYKDGIRDYIKEISDDKNFTSEEYFETDDIWGSDRNDRDEYKSKFELAYVFNNDNPTIESYHNSSYLLEGGSPHDAIKSAFVYAIDRIIKELNKYNKNEKKISFTDIEESLIIITNTYSTETQYKNQTKLAISNKFIKDKLNELLRNSLQVFFVENPLDAEKVANQVLANKRAREKAEKTRVNIKKKLKEKVDNMTNRIDDFVDCRIHGEEAELYLAEGLSAHGSVVLARDGKFQASLPMGGKFLNVSKVNNLEAIVKNKVIMNVIKVLGCGVELGKRHKDVAPFDISKMRYGKVIIASDSDADGKQISSLVITLFHELMPEVIKQGRLYIAKTPLYEIKLKNDDMLYAYSDDERDELIKDNEGKVLNVARSKGLGELSAEVMAETAMNPETRHLVRVTIDSSEKAKQALDDWMGINVDNRKEMISTNLNKYIYEVIAD